MKVSFVDHAIFPVAAVMAYMAAMLGAAVNTKPRNKTGGAKGTVSVTNVVHSITPDVAFIACSAPIPFTYKIDCFVANTESGRDINGVDLLF